MFVESCAIIFLYFSFSLTKASNFGKVSGIPLNCSPKMTCWQSQSQKNLIHLILPTSTAISKLQLNLQQIIELKQET
jgi:hypothetical protein